MAKVTNFLSIALLVSVFAVSPAFAASGFCSKVSTTTHWILDGFVYPVNWLDGKFTSAPVAAAPAVAEVRDGDTVITAAVPAVEAAPASMSALYRTAKFVTVIAIASPAVLTAVQAAVSAIQDALGNAEEEADAEVTEPTRLVLGRKA